VPAASRRQYHHDSTSMTAASCQLHRSGTMPVASRQDDHTGHGSSNSTAAAAATRTSASACWQHQHHGSINRAGINTAAASYVHITEASACRQHHGSSKNGSSNTVAAACRRQHGSTTIGAAVTTTQQQTQFSDTPEGVCQSQCFDSSMSISPCVNVDHDWSHHHPGSPPSRPSTIWRVSSPLLSSAAWDLLRYE